VRYPDIMDLPDTATVRIEVSRFDFVKRGVDGTVDFVSPLPSFFSYGSVEGVAAADGDPQDALVVGAAPSRGSRVEYPVWGQVLFVDDGVADHKWVVGPNAPTPRQWSNVAHFFRVYAFAKRCMSLGRRSYGETVFNGVEQKLVDAG
jgi:inorganic pyrophosphatase